LASWSRLALLVVLASLVAVQLVAVRLARADGDPASDYLLGSQTFVPPDAGFSAAEKQQLTQLVTGARRGTRLPGAAGRGGYGIRVAVIASRYDLGSVTVLAKQPKLYAHFLSQELRFVYKGRVLVVMPNGYGIANNGKPAPAEQKVLDRLPPPAAGSGSPLATATTSAVRALAANANVRIAAVQPPVARTTANGSTTRDRILIAAVALVLLCAAAVVVLYRRWR
jgi:hypothetical protein